MMMMMIVACRLTSDGPTVWTGKPRHLCEKAEQLNSLQAPGPRFTFLRGAGVSLKPGVGDDIPHEYSYTRPSREFVRNSGTGMVVD